jgi:hypothetical protein
MNDRKLNELILQSLEHEMGGVKVYEAALLCAVNDDLAEEWQRYLVETQTHVQMLEGVCKAFGLDPAAETPGRRVVRTVGSALVDAMTAARESGDPAAAQIVACECVVQAETKDHLDWELLGKCADRLSGRQREALADACEIVEDQEDEHLYHTRGWCRELWIEALGMQAVLPPLEEKRHVRTAIGAARAEQASEKRR